MKDVFLENQTATQKTDFETTKKVTLTTRQSRASEGESGTNPSDQKGITGPTPYQFGDIDAINVFNGNLTIKVPIGGKFPVGGNLSYNLGLHYNLKSWDIRGYTNPVNYVSKPVAFVDPFSNAGMGWRLSLDELFAPDTPPFNDDPFYWKLVSADGSQHKFFKTFRPLDNSTEQSDAYGPILFTQDGSFLRMRHHPNRQDKIVESPDGLIRIFNRKGKLRRMEDRFGNFMDISFPNSLTYVIKDNHGRRHEIKFQSFAETGPGNEGKTRNLVKSIRLAAFGGKTATYNFHYQEKVVQRHYRHEHPDVANTVKVPFLTSIEYPDGSRYTMAYYDRNQRVETNPDGTWTVIDHGKVSGLMEDIQMPTGGRYKYIYSRFGFTNYNGEFPSPSSQDGVLEKSICEANGRVLGKWKYSTIGNLDNIGNPIDPADKERIQRLVTDPDGNDTIYYFYNKVYNWKHGLPFSIYQSIGDGTNKMYLSKEIFQGAYTRRNKQRSLYVRYTADQLATMGKGNARVQCQRLIYHDDGNRFVETKYARYDGLGHFRNKRVISNFSKNKTTFTNYNHSRGNYDYDAHSETFLRPNTFKQPKPNNAWVLSTYALVDVRQQGMSKPSRNRFYFEWNTGFLRGIRVQGSLTPQATDVLKIYGKDQFGNRISEKYYGGDLQHISTEPNYGKILRQLLAPYYQINHAYQYGIKSRSQYFDVPANKVVPFKSLDQDIDKNSGLIRMSRDVSGLATEFIYDLMGRLTDVKPKDGKEAFIRYKYSVVPGQTYTYSWKYDNYAAGKPNLATSRTKFDHFGRPFREQSSIELQPVEKMSLRETKYNAMGRKVSVSERTFGNAAHHKTHYLSFDAFGRPKQIKLPDGEIIYLKYWGIRVVQRTVQIATGRTSSAQIVKTPCTTTEVYDAYNRLVQVNEPSGSSGGNHSTKYDYDYADRLIRVTQIGSGGIRQERHFEYDQRGFLKGERHPEKGSNGNGWVNYLEYDAKGHAHRSVDGKNKLTYTFDKAERLLLVRETGGKKLKEFRFGNNNQGANKQLGKLREAIRYNQGNIPWDTNSRYNIAIIEEYQYSGIGGRVSQRTSTIGFNNPSVTDYRFVQDFEYDRLGNVQRMGYPNATHVASGNHPRKVEFLYNAGLLSGVRELDHFGRPSLTYADRIAYHASGLTHQVRHGNGVVYLMEKDPNDMVRPHKILLQTPHGSNSMGPFHYDGAGNIIRVDILARNGYEDYIYDKVSRLKKNVSDEGRFQEYTFDPFGNISKITTKTDGVPKRRYLAINGRTNRISNALYDSAGNQLSSPQSGAKYTFDPFNMMNSLQAGNMNTAYLYTIDGERIWTAKYYKQTKKISHIFSLRNIDGKLLRQYKVAGDDMGNWQLDRDYIHRGKTLLASNSPTEGVRHYHPDHLGSPRVLTDGQGNGKSGHFYLPFGEEASNPNSDSVPLKFTGHERDAFPSADPLDYMHARFYSSMSGKFLSVDPVGGTERLPQSWNRYSYVYGNPLNITDPKGLFGVPSFMSNMALKKAKQKEEEEVLDIGYEEHVEVRARAPKKRNGVNRVGNVWIGHDGYVFENNPNLPGVSLMDFLKEYRDQYGLQGCSKNDNSCQVMDQATQGPLIEAIMRLNNFVGVLGKEAVDHIAKGGVTVLEVVDTLLTPYDPYDDGF